MAAQPDVKVADLYERVKGLRRDFRQRAGTWSAGQLKFLDESGLYLGMTPHYG